jgi:hypothetical protein
VRVKFFDHNTPFHIKDDEVVSYKFINWFRFQNQNWKANSKLKLKSRFKNTNQIGLCFYFSFLVFNFYLLIYKYYNIFNLYFWFLFMNTYIDIFIDIFIIFNFHFWFPFGCVNIFIYKYYNIFRTLNEFKIKQTLDRFVGRR